MNFKEQSETFLKAAQNRKRSPISQGTADKYRSNLAHALPVLGNRDLADINNGALKVLVAKLVGDGLAPTTVNGVTSVVKLVVASAVNEEGSQLYPRTWNHEFMELPVIDQNSLKAPVATRHAIETALGRANGQDKALYALLAGSGLRIGEAQALLVGPEDGVNSTWNPETGTLYIKSIISDGEFANRTKTKAGKRQVDLCQKLNAFLKTVLNPEVGKLMFRAPDGGPTCKMTIWRHMEKDGLEDGCHTLRRFRITELRGNAEIPEGLIKFWTGHANESITDRYDKIREDVSKRKLFAEKAGLGFELCYLSK
jgi:integrase